MRKGFNVLFPRPTVNNPIKDQTDNLILIRLLLTLMKTV